jgi:SAM-dependent methyltransferase
VDEPKTPAHEVNEEIVPGLDEHGGNESVRQRRGEWQATRELVPEVGDERMLDAACGTGYFAEYLVAQGADVVGATPAKRASREPAIDSVTGWTFVSPTAPRGCLLRVSRSDP